MSQRSLACLSLVLCSADSFRYARWVKGGSDCVEKCGFVLSQSPNLEMPMYCFQRHVDSSLLLRLNTRYLSSYLESRLLNQRLPCCRVFPAANRHSGSLSSFRRVHQPSGQPRQSHSCPVCRGMGCYRGSHCLKQAQFGGKTIQPSGNEAANPIGQSQFTCHGLISKRSRGLIAVKSNLTFSI